MTSAACWKAGRMIRSSGRALCAARTGARFCRFAHRSASNSSKCRVGRTALEFQLHRLALAQAAGKEADFELSAGDCAELFGEGTLYYFRYLHLFQLERWADTVRDTARNLRFFDFVHCHAAREEDRDNLEK